MTDWRPMAAALTEELVANGELSDPAWREALEAVPRHLFVPDHPLADAYANEPLVTQIRAATDATGGDVELPTSSASAPGAVAVMLNRLDVRDGMRVLEIGTGTGYNAALLCHRLGERNVFSVDLDPQLVSGAEKALQSAGYRPALSARDGLNGWEDAGPYDRILATCSITHVPPHWMRQLTDGGRIVAPLAGEEGGLMVFDKTAPDEVTGRFDRYQLFFMPLREDVDSPLASGHQIGYHGKGIAHYGTTDVDPAAVNFTGADRDLLLFLHLHLPGLRLGRAEYPHGDAVTVSTRGAEAQAMLAPTEPGVWATQQRGQRLWDTVEHASRRWVALGKPDRSRYGISALDDVHRQYVWLDDPDSPHAWPLPL